MRVSTRPKPKKMPGVRLHKPTGQYRITLSGKDHWLGTDLKNAFVSAYRLLGEWEANNRHPMLAVDDITMSEVCGRFKTDFCPAYHGQESRTLDDITAVCRRLRPYPRRRIRPARHEGVAATVH